MPLSSESRKTSRAKLLLRRLHAPRDTKRPAMRLVLLAAGLVALLAVRSGVQAAGGQAPQPQNPRRFLPRQRRQTPAAQQPQPTQPTQPQPTTTPAPSQQPPAPGQARPAGVGFRLENADLLQFISLVAGQLKINYVVDPAVKGSVTINTAGELRSEDLLPILETVLEINGATAVASGNFYRIVPLNKAAKAPLSVLTDSTGKDVPKDDRMVMEIIPLKFVLVDDMSKMLSPFLSDGGTLAVHAAGNVMILVDNSLNVKRLMDILTQFDNPAFAEQRVRLVSVHNNVASALVPELESIFSAYALNAKSSPLRFLPLDRINAILAVAADPAAFAEVEKWVAKLDQPAAPSGIQTFVYKVQNSEATYLGQLLKRIRGGGKSESGGGPGAVPAEGGGSSAISARLRSGSSALGSGLALPGEGSTQGSGSLNIIGGSGGGLGGLGLGMDSEGADDTVGGVRIISDPVNNSLIIESTPAEYAEIAKTLAQLDVLPKQALIEARVYEVTLTGDLSLGLEYFLQARDNAQRLPLGSFSAANNLQASVGTLVGQSRELLAFLNASENRTRVRVLSSPSVLATDNTDATIEVGEEVPILTSQGVVGGVQVGSNTLFTNTIQNRDAGIILKVRPRITSTGLVSLDIGQEISTVVPPPAGGIQSPSFAKRSIKTHTVVKDGDTIALGGLISSNVSTTTNRIPLLGDIPLVGALFGSTSYTTSKTELVVVLTPRIVSTSQDARAATAELEDKVKDLRRLFKKDKILNP